MFSDDVIRFYSSLRLDVVLPEGIRAMNPFADPAVADIAVRFYRKFYHDDGQRKLIIAINPGRLGAGSSGVHFTDTDRLARVCGISHSLPSTHEPSSVFVYDLIDAFGGPELFYREFYIMSVCPLGFVRMGPNGREVNYNYYDSKELQETVRPFILESLKKQLEFNVSAGRVICWGRGKNHHFLDQVNREHRFFGEIIPLDHPRFIMQYRAKRKAEYIEQHLRALGKPGGLPDQTQ
jgi:hypothetical protein